MKIKTGIAENHLLYTMYINKKDAGNMRIDNERKRICIKCGLELNDDELFCRRCGTKYSLEPQICPKCKTKSPHDSEFCRKCGYSFHNSNKKIFKIVLFIILGIFLSGTIFIFSQFQKEKIAIEESIAVSKAVHQEAVDLYVQTAKEIYDAISASDDNFRLFEGCYKGITQMQGKTPMTISVINNTVTTVLNTQYSEEKKRKEQIDLLIQNFQHLECPSEDLETLKECVKNLYGVYRNRYFSINGGMPYDSVEAVISTNTSNYQKACDELESELKKYEAHISN